MSAQCAVVAKAAPSASMSFFERYLTLWVFLCILLGIALGQFFPGAFQAIGAMEIAQVNLPVGLLIWVMVIPMLVKVDFGALNEVRQHVRGIGVQSPRQEVPKRASISAKGSGAQLVLRGRTLDKSPRIARLSSGHHAICVQNRTTVRFIFREPP